MHFDELRRFSPKSLEAHRKDRTYSLENLRCHSILRISCKSYNCTSAAPQSQNQRSCRTTLCSDSYRSRPPLLIDHRLNNFTSASSKALNQQTQIHLLPAPWKFWTLIHRLMRDIRQQDRHPHGVHVQETK
jgi:hypothetical protein